MNYYRIILVLILIGFSTSANSQNIIVDDTKSPQQLVTDVLINNSCLTVKSVNGSGNPSAVVGNSYASFSAGTSGFPFKEGVVLSTSPSKNAAGPFVKEDSYGYNNHNWKGDEDLNKILNTTSSQATVLEFDFVAHANSFSFNYIFASNEYLSYFPCMYSDGFAFLIKKANSNEEYKNLAVMPNTSLPVSATTIHPKIEDVTVNGIPYKGCDPANEKYFNGYNSSTSPVNYAGQTVVMTAQTEVVIGETYHLKLVVADDLTGIYNSAVFIESGSFVSKFDFGEDKTFANNNPVCFGERVVLDTKLDNTYSYKWFKDGNEILGENNSTYAVNSTGTYTVKAFFLGTNCEITGRIKIEYAADILFTNTSLLQCDDNADGFTVYDLTKVNNIVKNNVLDVKNVGFYKTFADAEAKLNPILTPEKYANEVVGQKVFTRIEKYNCYKIATVSLAISNTSIASQNPIAICDEDDRQDGFYLFNLSQQVTPQLLQGLPAGLTVNYFLTEKEAIAETNLLPNVFKNTIPFTQTVFARIINGSDCYDVVPVELIVKTFDPPSFEEEIKYLCKNQQLTLSVDNSFSSYLWSTGNNTNFISVSAEGDYAVTVTGNNGCTAVKKFKVILSEPAFITAVEVKDFSANDNSVLLVYKGVGNYEFSLDGKFFQNEPLFRNVLPGKYTAIIRDKNACGLSGQFVVYVLDYPRVFTPNGDGYNDLWQVKTPDLSSKFELSIFNRYGKLLKQINQNDAGWNGSFQGKLLPADDYWFSLVFSDGKIVKGHFSLKR